ncbi:MAG: serine/threonine protein kinase [Chitinophagaceae bacterium]|nr:MAG: serine/threonine protein kinase [Chitinophagaceae bacterium]
MIGKQIQNYQIGSHLGQGGMGTVYRATDIILGREVALKMLHTPMMSQPQVLERFKKEAQVLARLLHPNIAVIYNLIEQDQQHFMVMEFVEGKDLDGLLKQHRVLPPMAVVTAFIQALEGLHHAHKKGIFHRDIKPSNLILTPDGTVKLMDFGIAKVAGEQRLTQVNRVIGTVEFLAPELIEGKDPSAASDVYAAGMTMYELLCGRLPFENNTDYNLMQEILKKKPVSPDKLNASVPAPLAAIVMKALEKKPEHRFADAKAFQSALANAFPATRDADITHLFSNAVVPLPGYDDKHATGTKEVPKPAATAYLKPSYLLRMLNLPVLMKVSPLKAIGAAGLRERLKRLDRRTAVIGFCMLAVVVTTMVLVLGRNTVIPEVVADNQTGIEEPAVNNIRPVSLPENIQPSTADTGAKQPLVLEIPAEPVTGKTPADPKKTIEKKETKEQPVTKEEVKPTPAPVVPEKEIEKTPEPVEVVKPKASGSMVLNSKMEISL